VNSGLLLIVGAGHEQVPAILKAQAMGLQVVVTDQNPDAPGMALADIHRVVSTDDREGNLAVGRELGIHGVMTIGSETAVPVVAHVAAALGLSGFSEATALAATNKNRMRECFAQFDVPTTESEPIETLEQAYSFVDRFGFPVVLKPSDSSGQRGTTLINDFSMLHEALADALHFASDAKAIIEKFYAGPEINVTAIVQNGIIRFLSFSERITAPPPHFGIAIEHVSPPALNSNELQAIRDACEKSIRSVGLKNGIAYPQVLHTHNGPKVLEIAVRIPGGHMYEVALNTSGIDMIEFSILTAMGHPTPLSACTSHPTSAALSVLFLTELDLPCSNKAVESAIDTSEALAFPGVKLARINLVAGQKIPSLSHSGARFGAVMAVGATRDEARSRSRHAGVSLLDKLSKSLEFDGRSYA
jgi:biotin carboxylase